MIQARERGEQFDLNKENPDAILYKIDVPANRYDLLCIEGLTRSLRIFLGLEEIPQYKPINPNIPIVIHSDKNVKELRPIVVGAILRDFTFDEEVYKSFIDLQEKLHKNICRERRLVSIGTHDLDTLKPPIRYLLKEPSQIVFTPLQKSSIEEWAKKNQKDPKEQIDARLLFEILKTVCLLPHSLSFLLLLASFLLPLSSISEPNFFFLKKDEHLRKYLKLIDSHDKWPVLVDSNDTVLSLPPILNGEHSKIKLSTKNILIEITALDWTKANIVLNTFVSMFSEYCSSRFQVEVVKIVDFEGKEKFTPNLENYEMLASKKYVEKGLGLSLEDAKIEQLLHKMSLKAKVSGDEIKVRVPVTRSDVMQQCDIWEDIAIAYGYNNLPIKVPETKCFGRQEPLNQLTDLLRHQIAQAGYLEVLTEVLISKDDNFNKLNLEYQPNISVQLEQSTTKMKESFEIARTHLLPCLLKTLRSNQSAPLPIRLFEVSDIVLLDASKDTGSKNERHLSAIYASTSASFEMVHGLLDRVFLLLQLTPHFQAKAKGSYKLVKANRKKSFSKVSFLHFSLPLSTKKKTTCSSLEQTLKSKVWELLDTLVSSIQLFLKNLTSKILALLSRSTLNTFFKKIYLGKTISLNLNY